MYLPKPRAHKAKYTKYLLFEPQENRNAIMG